MPPVVHLKALQALEMALREGSLKAAGERLGITPAAVGQRIRTLEDHLGSVLLRRDRSGLRAGAELEAALADLRLGFEALERAARTLDFQRVSEIHIVAEPDWAELWLLPRLAAFRAAHPNIRLCVNGVGDVPVRLGAPDLRVFAGEGPGEPLYQEVHLPVTGPDNPRRIARENPQAGMEGMPLLHLKAQREGGALPGWGAWFRAFGQRVTGTDRGITYPNARLALPAVRMNAGFLVCGLSLVLPDLERGAVVLPFAPSQHLRAASPYRVALRHDAAGRPQVARFLDWLRAASAETAAKIAERTGTVAA